MDWTDARRSGRKRIDYCQLTYGHDGRLRFTTTKPHQRKWKSQRKEESDNVTEFSKNEERKQIIKVHASIEYFFKCETVSKKQGRCKYHLANEIMQKNKKDKEIVDVQTRKYYSTERQSEKKMADAWREIQTKGKKTKDIEQTDRNRRANTGTGRDNK